MTARTIRIIETCEFGEAGDLARPEPYDVAVLLVESRRVAVYADEPAGPASAAPISKPLVPAEHGSKRRKQRR